MLWILTGFSHRRPPEICPWPSEARRSLPIMLRVARSLSRTEPKADTAAAAEHNASSAILLALPALLVP